MTLYIYQNSLLHECKGLPEDQDCYHNYYEQGKDIFYCTTCNIEFSSFLALGFNIGLDRLTEIFIGEKGVCIINPDLKFTQILIL